MRLRRPRGTRSADQAQSGRRPPQATTGSPRAAPRDHQQSEVAARAAIWVAVHRRAVAFRTVCTCSLACGANIDNPGEPVPLKPLIRGSRVRALEGRHPALGSSHLIAEIHRVLATYYDRRTSARPPDVPVRELGRVRPPVRDILVRGSPGLRRLLFLHHALPASLSSRLSIEQSSTEQSRYTT